MTMRFRNAPCACGSGIKFKKCCGAPTRYWGTWDLKKLRWTKLLAYAGDESARAVLDRCLDPKVSQGWYRRGDDLDLAGWEEGLSGWGDDVCLVSGMGRLGVGDLVVAREKATAAVRDYARRQRTCLVPGCIEPVACMGVYEDPNETPAPCCSVHCGHGNEDGWCILADVEEPDA